MSNEVNNLYAFGNTKSCGRDINEDAYFVGKVGKFVVLAVADGNGTVKGMLNPGRLALTVLLDYLERRFKADTSINEISDILDGAFFTVSRSFLSVNAIDEYYSNVYASMSVAVIDELSMYMFLASTGNCEVYRLAHQKFTLLNEPQSEAFAECVGKNARGDWNNEEWRTHPKRGILTSALGVYNNPKIDIFGFQLQTSDIVFMTTDGLLRVTGPIGITETLGKYSESMDEGVNMVLNKAEEYDVGDNCTLICLYVNSDNGMTLNRAKEKEIASETFKRNYNNMVDAPEEKNSNIYNPYSYNSW